MKKLLRAHPNAILVTLAIVFLGVLIGFLVSTINEIFYDASQVLATAPASSGVGFNIDQADKLNFHGVSTSTATSTVYPAPPASVAPIIFGPATTTPSIPTTTSVTAPPYAPSSTTPISSPVMPPSGPIVPPTPPSTASGTTSVATTTTTPSASVTTTSTSTAPISDSSSTTQ